MKIEKINVICICIDNMGKPLTINKLYKAVEYETSIFTKRVNILDVYDIDDKFIGYYSKHRFKILNTQEIREYKIDKLIYEK